jgi:hypothetical protein
MILTWDRSANSILLSTRHSYPPYSPSLLANMALADAELEIELLDAPKARARRQWEPTMRAVALALVFAVLFTAPGDAQQPNTQSNGDVFNSNPGGLPGEPQIGSYGTDPECGGTNRAFYDQMYHTQGVVMSVQQMQQYYRQDEIQRCGDCSKSGPNRVICWLKPGITPGSPGDLFNSNGMPQGQPPPSNYNTGPQPPPGNNFGKVCPPTMSPQQAAAQGCRFLGSVTGYDICANPNADQYPQCRETTTPGGGPSNYQIWLGVTMPTQNCEQENTRRPATWQYDCSTWCKSFLHYNRTEASRPQLPAICDKYIHLQPPQVCSASDAQACDCQMANPFPPVPVGTGYPEQTIVNIVELWKARIDRYWTIQFKQRLQSYRKPGLRISRVPGVFGYQRATETILYNPDMVNAIIARVGIFGFVVALAHEEGHHTQWIDHRPFPEQVQRELDADRLAGSYFQYAQLNHFASGCNFASAVMSVFVGGDMLPPFNRHAHGSSAQRVNGFMQGYLHGANPF